MNKTVRIVNDRGKKVVEINAIIFNGKRKIDWESVERYLKRYIGKNYVIDETYNIVYIGTDFPDEYVHSKYRKSIFGTKAKAKANIVQAIPELISVASNIRFKENLEDKHILKAQKGWYYGTVHFTLPILDEKRAIVGKNKFMGRMIIRCSSSGIMYLYDIVDIKKET